MVSLQHEPSMLLRCHGYNEVAECLPGEALLWTLSQTLIELRVKGDLS
jgi:hypothetical protein